MNRKSRIFTLFFAVSPLIPVSCAPELSLSIPSSRSAHEHWEALVSAAPLPEGIRLREALDPPEDDTPDGSITLTRIIGPLLEDRLSAGQNDGGSYRLVIARSWLAEPVHFYDLAASSAADPPGPPALVPITDIHLPLIARPVHGLDVSSIDYPLVEQWVLEVDRSDISGKKAHDIDRWIAALAASRHLAPAPRLFWLGAVGDIMPGRGVTELLAREDGLQTVFGNVLAPLAKLDFLMGNLEGPLTTRGSPAKKTYRFRFDPSVLAPLSRAGFSYLSIANNHSMDYGQTGFLDTLDHIGRSPIASSGAGRNLAEAVRPFQSSLPSRCAELPAEPLSLAVLAAGAWTPERSGFDGAKHAVAGPETPGILWAGSRNPAAQAAFFAALKDLDTPNIFTIATIHGGPEWALEPPAWQRKLYRSLVDAGADLVIGHHAHVVQGFECYRGKLIAHSLGNFIFPGMQVNEYGEQSLILKLGIVDERILYMDFIPVQIDHHLLSLSFDGRMLLRVLESSRRLNPKDPPQ